MLVLVAYDVNTETPEGRRRLRRVAQACEDFGHRVQKSVFECLVGERELVVLRKRLLDEIDAAKDNLRLYFLDELTRRRTEQYGVGTVPDMEGPLIA
ncbi:MAG: CRISPR-associated endonuclease Cas2 [Phycisphaerae bacterium]